MTGQKAQARTTHAVQHCNRAVWPIEDGRGVLRLFDDGGLGPAAMPAQRLRQWTMQIRLGTAGARGIQDFHGRTILASAQRAGVSGAPADQPYMHAACDVSAAIPGYHIDFRPRLQSATISDRTLMHPTKATEFQVGRKLSLPNSGPRKAILRRGCSSPPTTAEIHHRSVAGLRSQLPAHEDNKGGQVAGCMTHALGNPAPTACGAFIHAC